jgi:hypothetical protein
LAKALRADRDRLNKLEVKGLVPDQFGGPLTAAEKEEECMLRARIAERARAIGCPAAYGLKERRNDGARLVELLCKRRSPPSCGGGTLNEAEDAEEAQLIARAEAFNETPEGHARARIDLLRWNKFRELCSPDEQNELDRLVTLYPDPPPDPRGVSLDDAIEAWGAAIERESRKRADEWRLARENPHRRDD